MFEQHVDKTANVIQPRFSFMYPNLRCVNKVNKKGNSSAAFVLFLSY